MATPTDPLFAQQWHLSMLGNIRKVWNDYTGAGVRVAVYDDGVETGHADLAANYDASMHFRFDGVTHVPTPNGSVDAHGTAVSGIIAAVDNNGVGGSGVAHGAKITGMDYLNDLQSAYDWTSQTTSAEYTAIMRWAAKFDIMSNSWGTTPGFADELNLNRSGNSSAVDAGHFAWVSAHGRGGLGTVVVKAAGNETMNANGDGTNVSRHTITVAATTKNGMVADYSNFGSSILITAPAAAVTTDLSGNRGYNRSGTSEATGPDALAQTDYTSTFGGTSAATPVVSGVVALMLEANAGLGWRDVQSILVQSAGHTGSAVGSGARGSETGVWTTMGGNQWNGGGAIYHLSYGFGMVDAYGAVRLAEVWGRLHGAADTSANEVLVRKTYAGADVQIKDSDNKDSTPEAQISFAVAENRVIDSVHVTLNINHDYGQDLVIFLRSPTGQQIALFNREGEVPGDSGSNFGDVVFDGGVKWTFAAEAFRGMGTQGTWKVIIHDRSSGDEGEVTDARLDFYGSASSTNDVYTFTDDFRMLRGLQASRRVIDDTDGGSDWLNFAAVTGNLSVNMAAGGAIKISGTALAKLASGAADFERVQAGDGNDKIFGNAKANSIFAGRGADVIQGGEGNDKLWGDAGNDILRGDGGSDVLNGGTGQDVFVFSRGFGSDRITGWQDNQDTLRLDDAIWGGGLSISQVIARFGEVVSGAAVLEFNARSIITVVGFSNLNSLIDDITII